MTLSGSEGSSSEDPRKRRANRHRKAIAEAAALAEVLKAHHTAIIALASRGDVKWADIPFAVGVLPQSEKESAEVRRNAVQQVLDQFVTDVEARKEITRNRRRHVLDEMHSARDGWIWTPAEIQTLQALVQDPQYRYPNGPNRGRLMAAQIAKRINEAHASRRTPRGVTRREEWRRASPGYALQA